MRRTRPGLSNLASAWANLLILVVRRRATTGAHIGSATAVNFPGNGDDARTLTLMRSIAERDINQGFGCGVRMDWCLHKPSQTINGDEPWKSVHLAP